MRLELSKEEGIYGTVTGSDHRAIQILFTDISDEEGDGISVELGGTSSFEYFMFIPREVFDTLVSVHSLGTFEAALVMICDHLLRSNE